MGIYDRDWIKPKPTLGDRWGNLHPGVQAGVFVGLVLLGVYALYYLGDKGQDPWDESGANYELDYALSTGDVKLLKRLIALDSEVVHASVAWMGSGMGPDDRLIHYAAVCGHPAIVATLIEHGAEVDTRGTAGRTALHYAASSEQYTSIEVLLAHGADVSVTDEVGFTPLIEAAGGDEQQCFAAVNLLIQHGADVNHRTSEGTTPLGVASGSKNWRIVELLKQHGAKMKE